MLYIIKKINICIEYSRGCEFNSFQRLQIFLPKQDIFKKNFPYKIKIKKKKFEFVVSLDYAYFCFGVQAESIAYDFDPTQSNNYSSDRLNIANPKKKVIINSQS